MSTRLVHILDLFPPDSRPMFIGVKRGCAHQVRPPLPLHAKTLPHRATRLRRGRTGGKRGGEPWKSSNRSESTPPTSTSARRGRLGLCLDGELRPQFEEAAGRRSSTASVPRPLGSPLFNSEQRMCFCPELR